MGRSRIVFKSVVMVSLLLLALIHAHAQELKPSQVKATALTDQAPSTSHSNPFFHRLQLSGEVFGGYRYTRTSAQDYNAFQLERTEIGIQSPQKDDWGFEVRLESVRSAGEGSLIGIDGDSIITRVKRAWGYGLTRWGNWTLYGRIGLIPDSWHEEVMQAYPLRSVAPSQVEREGFQDTSDLGASLYLGYKRQRIFLSVTNGEGRRLQEQNQGKNILLGASFALPLVKHHTLHLSLAYRDGSRGISSGQDHRIFSTLWWSSLDWQAGLMGAHAWGLAERPSLEATAVQGWIAGWIMPEYLGLFLSGEWLRYHPGKLALIGYEQSVDPSIIQPVSTRDAMRWSGGFAHRIHQTAPADGGRNQGITVNLYERIEYRGASNLNSPVFGIPQLATEWRLSLLFSIAWGPLPSAAFPSQQVLGM